MKYLLPLLLLFAGCLNPAPTRPLRLGMTWKEAKEANGGRLILDSSYYSKHYEVRVANVRGTRFTFERDDGPGRHFVLVSRSWR